MPPRTSFAISLRGNRQADIETGMKPTIKPSRKTHMQSPNYLEKADNGRRDKSANGKQPPPPDLVGGGANSDFLVGALPCLPCPHKSVCCKHGTALTPEEGRALLAEFGEAYVFYDGDRRGMWGAGEEFRTQTWNGRCAFHKNGDCMIHEHAHYPSMCRLFPFKDARNPMLPHAYDAGLCPEFANWLAERTVALTAGLGPVSDGPHQGATKSDREAEGSSPQKSLHDKADCPPAAQTQSNPRHSIP